MERKYKYHTVNPPISCARTHEPLQVKAQAIKSATEASTMLLKIDDVIATAKMSPPAGGPGGMPGGMSGMGGMPGSMPPI